MTLGPSFRCTIVIPVYSGASLTRQLINLLLAEPPAEAAEIVVVDDGSRDLTPRFLAGYGDRIRVVTHAINQGYSAACNTGSLVAAGEYLIFLRNDTLPRTGWLDALIGYADAHPSAGAVGTKLLHPDGTVQHAGVVFGPSNGGAENMPGHLYYGFPGNDPAVNTSRRFQAVTGACVLVRRQAFESVGGFDPVFVNAYDDIDLCLRLGERGWEIHYCHLSEIVRFQSPTQSPKGEVEDPLGDLQRAEDLFRERWANRVQRDDVRYYLEDGLLLVRNEPHKRAHVELSPLLGAIETDGREGEADRLIMRYAARVDDLLRDRNQLEARLGQLDVQRLAIVQDKTISLAGTWSEWFERADLYRRREFIAALHLRGSGIEIGALNAPLDVPRWVNVRYVDCSSLAALRAEYPELEKEPLVEPDIIDDGERLATVADGSQDFVIANHFVEHCEDPIGAIATILRVLKPDGIAYLGIPDKRFTFDSERPVTPFDHLLRDHRDGPSWSRVQHFDEWVEFKEGKRGREAVALAEKLMETGYGGIHYHVWSQAELFEMFGTLHSTLGFPFDVVMAFQNVNEMVFILKKTPAV